MYQGRIAALATRHDKHSLIAPSMGTHLGLEVRTAAVDTDRFGTFSGEVPRSDDMLKTAIAKARSGMRDLGLPLGFASEGSIGSEGFLPITDLELVVFVDDDVGFYVAESCSSLDIKARAWIYDTKNPLEEELERAGFPEHGLIVRLPNVPNAPIFKGIHDLETLLHSIDRLAQYGQGQIMIETDLRANHCPSRRPHITSAAERLALRLTRTCPSCGCPGWGEIKKIRGRRCASCDAPTYVVLGHLEGCASCSERCEAIHNSTPVDPANCPYCNP